MLMLLKKETRLNNFYTCLVFKNLQIHIPLKTFDTSCLLSKCCLCHLQGRRGRWEGWRGCGCQLRRFILTTRCSCWEKPPRESMCWWRELVCIFPFTRHWGWTSFVVKSNPLEQALNNSLFGKCALMKKKLLLTFEWEGILSTKSKVDLGCDTRKERKGKKPQELKNISLGLSKTNQKNLS